MTDTIRDLLISLASHVAYMQGQLEARHELDDPEDYYWYRESVLLRQKVTDVLADGPAVPEGREPASVTGQPTDKEPTRLRNCPTHGQQPPWAWGCPECVRQLREELAALQQRHPEPVPVSERLPGPEDCDAEGRCWLFSKVEKEWRLIDAGNPGVPHLKYCFTHWLPAHALPVPEQEVEE